MGLLTLNELSGLGQSVPQGATIRVGIYGRYRIAYLVHSPRRRWSPEFRAAVSRAENTRGGRRLIAAWHRSRQAHDRAAGWAQARRERAALAVRRAKYGTLAARFSRLARTPPKGRTSTATVPSYRYANPKYRTMLEATGVTRSDCRAGKFPAEKPGYPWDYESKSREWWWALCKRIYLAAYLDSRRARRRARAASLPPPSRPAVSAVPWVSPEARLPAARPAPPARPRAFVITPWSPPPVHRAPPRRGALMASNFSATPQPSSYVSAIPVE
jgi:hypothetical protein